MFDFLIEESGEKRLLGKKQLFIADNQDEYKIIGDLYQTYAPGFRDVKFPIVHAAQEFTKDFDQNKIISAFGEESEEYSGLVKLVVAGYSAEGIYSKFIAKHGFDSSDLPASS